MNRNLGYNRTEGGDGCQGTIVSDETKQKLRKFNLGKHLSDDTKEKMSISRTGSKNWKSKEVNQYSLDGNFIKLWDCISTASKACRGKSKTSGGYIWILN